MKLTTLEVGLVPEPLQAEFVSYPKMVKDMFDKAGGGIEVEAVEVSRGEALPALEGIEAVLIPGSAAGVYDDFEWIAPLREFIRSAYDANIPMLGICFGHQIIADALGGDVRKSEKGWGLGRHSYSVTHPDVFAAPAPAVLAIACSHQDQVITPPQSAKVFMSSDFTPNAGLVYDNGKVLTVQPHPEFEDDYTLALAKLRRGRIADDVVDQALNSMATPSDQLQMAKRMRSFIGVSD